MRLWAEVYDSSEALQGIVTSLTDASISNALDGQGVYTFNIPAADKTGFDLLMNEMRVRLYIEQDGTTRELGRGVVRGRKIISGEGGRMITILGPDDLDALTRRSTLLGRNYVNQTMQTIADDLIALVPGWSVTVASPYADYLQSARFEGTHILKALIRLAQEMSLHLRAGSDANTLDIGYFGSDNGIWAVAPQTISPDILLNNEVVLINNISQTTNSRDVVNWIIPIGAGEGTAAQTLKESTRSISGGYAYDIGTLTGPDGRTLYYLSDADSIASYGQIEKIVTFKEIGPVANSENAKIYAANALYDAAVAWLQRNKDPLESYSLTVKKARTPIQPGDKIRVTYKDYIETIDGEVVPIDLDYQAFWVMKTTERIGTEETSVSLEIASVDRVEMDTAQVIVGAIEAIDVRNVSVQTFPCFYQDSSERICQGWPGVPPSYPAAKNAIFSLQFPDLMTDVISVKFQIISRPLYMNTNEYWGGVAPTPLKYWYVLEGDNYPCDLGMIVNGVDVTSDLGGPWNPSGGNSAVNTTLDISSYILDASGGIFQTHTIEIYCGHKSVEQRVNTGYQSQVQDWSNGVIEGKFLVLGTAQGILPG